MTGQEENQLVVANVKEGCHTFKCDIYNLRRTPSLQSFLNIADTPILLQLENFSNISQSFGVAE